MGNPVLLKPNMKVYIALLIVAVAAMVALYRCAGRGGNVGHIAGSGGDTIDVAIEYAPLSLYMYDDTLGGFNYDLLRLLEREEGLCVKMHPVVNLKESLEKLDNGVYDIVVAQVPATVEFKQRYLFSDSIYLDRQILVQLKDSVGNTKVKTQLDLAGKTLYAVGGSPAISRIHNLSRELGDTINVMPETRYGQEQLFLMVASGEIDYAVINYRIAESLSAQYPQVDISTDISFNQLQSWIMRKDDVVLCDSLNVWLRRIRKEPSYQETYSRYFCLIVSLMLSWRRLVHRQGRCGAVLNRIRISRPLFAVGGWEFFFRKSCVTRGRCNRIYIRGNPYCISRMRLSGSFHRMGCCVPPTVALRWQALSLATLPENQGHLQCRLCLVRVSRY